MISLDGIKDYLYWVYLAIAGYVGWNHKRIDDVIKEQAITAHKVSALINEHAISTQKLDLVIKEQTVTSQKVNDLRESVDHVREGIDKITDHLLEACSRSKK